VEVAAAVVADATCGPPQPAARTPAAASISDAARALTTCSFTELP
jgi:hypothetical protein